QKKGSDGKALIAALRQAINDNDREVLATFLSYIEGRHQSLVEPLDERQKEAVHDELERLIGDRILILPHGEIEDYLPGRISDVKAIVSLTTNRNWINTVPDREHRSIL